MKRISYLTFLCLLLHYEVTFAQDIMGPASKNTFFTSGIIDIYTGFVQDEETAWAIEFSNRTLWFPVKGLGIGTDADVNFFNSHFNSVTLGLGPRIAYYLAISERLQQLLPNLGCSVQYVLYDLTPGFRESGWRFNVGLGTSLMIGKHLTLPIEIGFIADRTKSEEFEGKEMKYEQNRIYLKIGLGAFFWKTRSSVN